MATALNLSEVGQTVPANDLAPIRKEWPDAPPARYIFREVSLELNGGLQFFYRNPGLARPLLQGGIEAVIAALIAPPPRAVSLMAAPPGPAVRQSPLDLRIYGLPAYVVLKLDPELNWHFSADQAAVSLKTATVGESYGGLRHVLPDGTIRPEPGPGCSIVYFVARPPAIGPDGSYRHGLNFHVELVQNISGGSSESSILPIIIDPDVGYPGGSNT
jgi:hypothetical protein